MAAASRFPINSLACINSLIGLDIAPRYKTEAGDVANAFVPQVLRETDSEKMPSSADDFFAFENVSRPVLQPAYRYVSNIC
jgi:hypothetical protein